MMLPAVGAGRLTAGRRTATVKGLAELKAELERACRDQGRLSDADQTSSSDGSTAVRDPKPNWFAVKRPSIGGSQP
jgi:hypothetical protein